MGLVYLYTIKINEMWVNIPSSHGSVMGNGFCIGSDDAFHHSNSQQWQQGFQSFVTMIQMTVEPNLVAYNVTFREDSTFFVVGFLVLVFCWNLAAGRMHEFGEVAGCELNTHGKKTQWKPKKNGRVMPWKHTQQPPFHQRKLLAKKNQRFWSFNSTPPRSWCVLERYLVFFPVGFCSMGFLFLTKTDGNKKNMAMSAQLLHFFYCEIYCRFFFCWCLMSSFFLLRLGLWTLGHKKLPMPLIRENKGGKLSPTLGCHHLRNKARKKRISC